MAKKITDEEYNQISAAYDKFMADPNQDSAKVAQVQNLWNQVQEEYKAQKSITPQNDPMYDEMKSKSNMTDPYYYEHPEAANPQIKTNEQLAREVIQGKRGNGQARKNALANAGYDYNAVQRIVNQNFKPVVRKKEPPKIETETTEENPKIDIHAPEGTQFGPRLGRLSGQDAIDRGVDKQDIQYVQGQGGFFRDDGTGNIKAYDKNGNQIAFFPG